MHYGISGPGNKNKETLVTERLDEMMLSVNKSLANFDHVDCVALLDLDRVP